MKKKTWLSQVTRIPRFCYTNKSLCLGPSCDPAHAAQPLIFKPGRAKLQVEAFYSVGIFPKQSREAVALFRGWPEKGPRTEGEQAVVAAEPDDVSLFGLVLQKLKNSLKPLRAAERRHDSLSSETTKQCGGFARPERVVPSKTKSRGQLARLLPPSALQTAHFSLCGNSLYS